MRSKALIGHYEIISEPITGITNRSNLKISVADLNFALQHNEKLEELPNRIETNVIYRLSLASNTKGEFQSSQRSIKHIFCMFRCVQM
ncbi:unnamed protein product [Rotaria sp. Silwood2]|nr:unnamed protein product [Rotaria sp. Silwood2]